MTLAIIAAGESSRLKQEGIPGSKALVRVGGVPLIKRIIQSGLRAGADRLCCIINEQSSDVKEYLCSQQYSVPLHLIVQSTPSSMHSLFALARSLCDSPFCLAAVDTVFREDEFKRFLAFSRAKTSAGADGILAITRFIADEKPLCVGVDAQMRVIRLSDTLESFEWVTGGLYYFSPRIFYVIDDALRSGTTRLRNFLRLLLTHNYQLYGYPFSKMIDVDHVADIAMAEQFLAEALRYHHKLEYDQ